MSDGVRKVAIVGTAPNGRFAPFNDPTWELWGVGLRAEYFTRVDRWYEIHRLDGEPKEWAAEWRRLIKAWSDECQIYMFYPEEDIGPSVIHFQSAPLVKRFGQFFMTSSFAWMMAQALHEGVTEIGLWGVDMEYGTEYRQQRAGLRHFIDLARVLGVKMHRVASSGISYEPIPYPFWMDDPLTAKLQLRKNAYKENKTQFAYSVDELTRKLFQANGALNECQSILKCEKLDDELRQYFVSRMISLRESIADIDRTLTTTRDDLKRTIGALEEIDWLQDYLQP